LLRKTTVIEIIVLF